MAGDPRNQFERADALLSSPLAHEGLPPRRGARIRLRLWTHPAFAPWASWSLLEHEGAHFVRRVVWRRDERPGEFGDTFAAEARLAREAASELARALGELSFAPFRPTGGVRLDGTTFGVEAGDGGSAARVTWWGDPPPELRSLAAWYERAVDAFEAALPASTHALQAVRFP